MIRAKKVTTGSCMACGSMADVFQINMWRPARPSGRRGDYCRLCRECVGRLMMQCDLQLTQEEYVKNQGGFTLNLSKPHKKEENNES